MSWAWPEMVWGAQHVWPGHGVGSTSCIDWGWCGEHVMCGLRMVWGAHHIVSTQAAHHIVSTQAAHQQSGTNAIHVRLCKNKLNNAAGPSLEQTGTPQGSVGHRPATMAQLMEHAIDIIYATHHHFWYLTHLFLI